MNKELKLREDIYSYSDEEIMSMTDEFITNIINLNCAIKGIKLIQMPVLDKTLLSNVKNISPISNVYSMDSFNIHFTNQEEALKVLKLLTECKSLCSKDYSYIDNKYYYYLKPKSSDSDITYITSTSYYIRNDIDKYIEDNKLNLKINNDYKASLEEYHSLQKEYDAEKENIYDYIYLIRNKYNDFKKYCDILETQYFILTDDIEVAYKFLLKAYIISDDIHKLIIKKYNLFKDKLDNVKSL